MIKKGVYAASLSVLKDDLSLDIEATISHAEWTIKEGLHGVFFFGSTGQSQLISIPEKKELISQISSHKLKKQFFLGTGSNSLDENIDLIRYGMEFKFDTFLAANYCPYNYQNNTACFRIFYNHTCRTLPLLAQ